MNEHDFGYEEEINDNDVNPLENEKPENLNPNENPDNEGNDDGKKTDLSEVDEANKNNKETNDNPDNNGNKINYEEGTKITIDNKTYTIDANGNLVNDKNEIFKKADEVDAYLKEFESEEEDPNEITFASIKNAIGYNVTDEDGKDVEFESTPDGISKYLNAVIDNIKEETENAIVDGLYKRYPFMESMINYYTANGNSLEGYGEVKDRSNITIDADNEEQQIAIIKEAWKERGTKGSVDSYIQYLKSQDQLYEVAKQELEALAESDKAKLEEYARKAEEVERANIEKSKKYWKAVEDTINNRVIGKYKIPEVLTIVKNGVKKTATPKDFFDYLYKVDSEGRSAYENELLADTAENRMNDELLAAYIRFSGGSFASLVDMVAKEDKVKEIKLVSKQNRSTRYRSKSNTTKTNKDELDFGY